MPGAIVRKLTPEQEELDRKREELSVVRAALAERELADGVGLVSEVVSIKRMIVDASGKVFSGVL